MKRKIIRRLILCAVIYLILLCLLQHFETAPGAGGSETADKITSLGSAAWYSIVTLTTVGYGDIVPRSWEGKLIGGFFALLSTFLVAFLIGVVLSLMRGKLLPLIRLLCSRGRHWFIFEESNSRTRILGKKLAQEDPRCMVIFAGSSPGDLKDLEEEEGIKKSVIHTELCTEEVLRRASDRSRCSVLCLGENGFDNYQRAEKLLEKGVEVCCMTEYEPDQYPSALILYDPYISCAHMYWVQYPVRSLQETIVLIGSGKYAEALLEQALLVNVFDPGQRIRYVVYGDFGEFRRNHPYLGQICSLSSAEAADGKAPEADLRSRALSPVETPESLTTVKAPASDSLLFMEGPWNGDLDALKAADRIILCFDSEEKTLSVYNTLHRHVPTEAAVHARLSRDFDGLAAFGVPESLFTSESVLRKQLEQQAMAMHHIYLASTGQTSPGWEELSAFLRRSNIASADHLYTKVRLLLGRDVSAQLTKEVFAAAFRKWQEEMPEKKELFRRIEHERWMRFHLLNNWQYAEKRDNKRRLHPLLRPFDLLPEKEQEKDDYAWEMLGILAESGK